MKHWTRTDWLTLLSIAAPIIVALVIWLVGLPVVNARMDERMNSLKEVVNSTHAETVNTLKDHGSKLDNFGQRISHIEGALEHTVRTGTNGGE